MASCSDHQRFAASVAALGEAFNRQISSATIHAYRLGLDDLPIEAVELAARQAIRRSKFMPTPAELRAFAGELSHEDRAGLAWKAVRDSLAKHDYYHTVQFDDPAITATIRNMAPSWAAFCERLDVEGEVWARKDFERVYAIYRRRGVTGQEAAPLAGCFAMTNATTGHHHKTESIRFIATGLTPTRLISGHTKPGIAAEIKRLACDVLHDAEDVQ